MSFLGKTPDIHQFGFIYTDKLKRCMKFSEDHSKGLDIFLRIKPYDLNTQVYIFCGVFVLFLFDFTIIINYVF